MLRSDGSRATQAVDPSILTLFALDPRIRPKRLRHQEQVAGLPVRVKDDGKHVHSYGSFSRNRRIGRQGWRLVPTQIRSGVGDRKSGLGSLIGPRFALGINERNAP